MTENKKKFIILFCVSVVFYFGLFLWTGVGIYNDSHQYIAMHIHREPLYPFFLWVLRTMCGEGSYLMVAAVLQNILVSFVTAYFVSYFTTVFSLKGISAVVLLGLTFAPHILTPLCSAERVVLSSGIMSEAFCVPLFLLFMMECYKALILQSKKAIITSLIVAVLLSLTRAQLMSTILVWLVILVIKVLSRKEYKKIAVLILLTALAFILRGTLVKTYNYVFNDHFINNTYGGVNTLTNILYSSNREDGEHIKDSQARDVFYLMYDDMDEKQYNYKYAAGSIADKARHLEQTHDDLKFEVLEYNYLYYTDSLGIKAYIEQNLEADRISVLIMKDILPSCFFRWFGNYLLLSMNGLIRSIGIVNPVINFFVFILYVISLVGIVYYFRTEGRESKASWLMLLSLLSIAALSFSTSLTIMCLSRYMIYNFTVFYTALYILLIQFLRKKGVIKNGI